MEVEAPVTKEEIRVCSYFTQQRGCAKGDKCDFAHIENESSDRKNQVMNEKVCDFYIQDRGCIKGDDCDFAHPDAPNGDVTNRVCTFWMQPRGCAKKDECNFLHIGNRPTEGNTTGRVCQYHMTPRGCVKGNECDFVHTAPVNFQQGRFGGFQGGNPQFGRFNNGGFNNSPQQAPGRYNAHQNFNAGFGMQHFQHQFQQQFQQQFQRPRNNGPVRKRPQLCEFHQQPRGCRKGAMCDFIHQKDQICTFYATEKGCVKGVYCDFKHPSNGEGAAEEKSAGPLTSKGHRYRPY